MRREQISRLSSLVLADMTRNTQIIHKSLGPLRYRDEAFRTLIFSRRSDARQRVHICVGSVGGYFLSKAVFSNFPRSFPFPFVFPFLIAIDLLFPFHSHGFFVPTLIPRLSLYFSKALLYGLFGFPTLCLFLNVVTGGKPKLFSVATAGFLTGRGRDVSGSACAGHAECPGGLGFWGCASSSGDPPWSGMDRIGAFSSGAGRGGE